MAKHFRTLLGLFLGLLFNDSTRADTLPVEDFTRLPAYSQAMLSPDGQWVAYISPNGDYSYLDVLNLESKKKKSVVGKIGVGRSKRYYQGSEITTGSYLARDIHGNEIGLRTGIKTAPRIVYSYSQYDFKSQIGSFVWAGEKNLIASGGFSGKFQTGNLSYFADTEELFGLTWIYSHPDWIRSFFILDPLVDEAESALMLLENKKILRDTTPSVIKMNLHDRTFQVMEENPGDVVKWVTDSSGLVRVSLVESENGNFINYRPSPDDGWNRLEKIDGNFYDLNPIFVDKNNILYLSGREGDGNCGIFEFDLRSGEIKRTLVLNDHFDVFRKDYVTKFDGMPLEGLILSEDRSKILGIRYYSNVPRVKYFDPILANIQQQLDQVMPNSINLIKNASRDGTKILILSYSATNPGDYYLFDRDSMRMEFLASRMPWIEAEKMSMTYPISFKADDGMTIYGYRTDPPGIKLENLPLAVLPRSQLRARLQWEFDPLVQFLANRGFGVLQIDYRGATGYGTDYFRAGFGELTGKMPGDIIAGVNWAIDSGYANPNMIALVGSNFGVTCVLTALSDAPELFQCAAVVNGIYDWESILKLEKSINYKHVYNTWMQDLQDYISDESKLSIYSPLESLATTKIPILLIHNEETTSYPTAPAKRFARKLKKTNEGLKTVFLPDEGDVIFTQKNRGLFYQSLESFLSDFL